jgi:hypothetical protein
MVKRPVDPPSTPRATNPTGCGAQTATDPLKRPPPKFTPFVFRRKRVWALADNCSGKEPIIVPLALYTFTVTAVELPFGLDIAIPAL